jgi:hypothetical protein
MMVGSKGRRAPQPQEAMAMAKLHKLDMAQVKSNEEEALAAGRASGWASDIGAHQVAVYVMCGGGMLGRFAAEQPADFYIDTRVGRLPYGSRAIEQAVEVLQVIAEAHGLDPHNMPAMPHFHASGVF